MRINAGRVRRLWLVLLSLPLLMLMLAVPATPARAATAVNPFADLAGFTIYSSGDATLNNNELEGSVVAAHELSTSKQNYAVVHKVAGTGDYTIPVIDGVPVRMLANNYTIGASASAEPSFAVTNAGATTGTNEAQGSIKSVETSGWTAAERGGFVRVTPNAATPNFVIDLQSRAWSGTTSATEITRIKTQESSVAAYVSPDLTASTQCLASVVGNYVTVPAGDMAVLPALSTDRPNVFSYAELAGRTIKLNNNPGYQPTATAPIIVRVANGTTTIGKLNFEGWSSAAGAQQNYSSFILLDLSEVTNDVLIDGLEMGAIYAPQAEVTFNSNVTWNGQLIAGGFGAWGAGELHHHTFQPTLPCGSEPTTGRFAITKTVTGLNQGVDPGNFQFNYRIDQGPNQTATITPGTTWTSDQLPTGSVITITEVTPTPPAGHTFDNLTLGGDGVTVNNGTATLTIGNDTTTTVTALNTYGVEDVTDVDDDSDNDGGDATDTEVDQLASTGPMGIVWFLLIAGVATAGGALLLRLRRRLG